MSAPPPPSATTTSTTTKLPTPPPPLPAPLKELLAKGQKMLERKDYRLALKNLEQVLKKQPKHGETMTLKGVVLMHQAEGDENKKNEALQYIRTGLKLDESCIQSWKWYAHMLKYLKKYDEALPCLEHCVTMEKDVDTKNMYLRDIAAMQFQARLFSAYLATRTQMATAFKKNVDVGYFGMIIGNHMLGKYKPALQILDNFRPKLQLRFSSEVEVKVEFGLYRATLLREAGETSNAIKFLSTFFPTGPIDPNTSSDSKALPMCFSRPTVVRERVAELSLTSESWEVAREEFFSLLKESPENLDLHRGYQEALSYIDRALELQTEPSERADLLRFKARILKHAGDLVTAADVMDSARKLELSDRYLNNKTVKYMIRAGKLDTALSLANLFYREESKSDHPDAAVLHDSQCAWFENEMGETAAARHREHKDVIEAVKSFSWIRKHYDQYEDDQMEFHDFALRKFTLSSYLALTRFIDHARRVPPFRRAARGAVQVLLRVEDFGEGKPAVMEYLKNGSTNTSSNVGKKPAATEAAGDGGGNNEKEDETPMADAPAAKEEDADAALRSLGQQKHNTRSDIAEDADPKGWKLFQTVMKDPLREARIWVSLLTKQAPTFIETHLLAFDVAVRAHEFDTCVKSMERLVRLVSPETIRGAKCDGVFERLVPFLRFHAMGACAYEPWMGRQTPRTREFVLDQQVGGKLDALATMVFGTTPPLELAESLLEACKDDEGVIVATGTALLRVTGGVHGKALDKLMHVVKDLDLVRRVRDLFLEFPKGVLNKEKILDVHRTMILQAWPRAGGVIRNEKFPE